MAISSFLLWQPYKPLKYAAIACLVVLYAGLFWQEFGPPYVHFVSFVSYFFEYWRDILPAHLILIAILFAIGCAIHFIPVVMTVVIVLFAFPTVVQLLQWGFRLEEVGFKYPDHILFPIVITAIMACLLVFAAFVQVAKNARGAE
ncbi:MAG: hypothetical protein ACSHWY_11875 [Octadecabacter sp.]